jgi:hypothetical protein
MDPYHFNAEGYREMGRRYANKMLTLVDTGYEPGPDPDPDPEPEPTGLYQVEYSVNQWNAGFTAEVTITNNSSATINGWTLTWHFADGQKVTGSWNADVAQSGDLASASSTAGSWNGAIAANGGTVSFGFQATHTGTNSIPVDFKLNGVACNGGL